MWMFPRGLSTLSSVSHALDRCATWIREADALLIAAGAGMGVDSGLPDFRGDEGFWRAYPPMRALGLSFETMANPSWFLDDPQLAWGFYGHRLNLYRSTTPHDGFRVLREWARNKRDAHAASTAAASEAANAMHSFVFTSNVDGHFAKAGFDADHMLEIHGSIHHLQCTLPCSQTIWSAESTHVHVNEQTMRAPSTTTTTALPQCPRCKNLARPNILMFGDATWLRQRSQAQRERFNRWVTRVRQEKLRVCVIELGAGSNVPTVRLASEQFVVSDPERHRLVRLNVREPWLDTHTFRRTSTRDGHEDSPMVTLDEQRGCGISMPALQALHELDERVRR